MCWPSWVTYPASNGASDNFPLRNLVSTPRAPLHVTVLNCSDANTYHTGFGWNTRETAGEARENGGTQFSAYTFA